MEVLQAFRSKVAFLVKFCASETDCGDVGINYIKMSFESNGLANTDKYLQNEGWI
jgi:hypothetical protein